MTQICSDLCLFSSLSQCISTDTQSTPNSPQSAEELIQDGIKAKETGKYQLAIEKLRLSKALSPNPVINLHLGSIFDYLGVWKEAEREWKEGIAMENEGSEVTLRLCNGLIGMYHHRKRFSEAAEWAERVLSSWGDPGHDRLELLTSLYFLCDSLYCLDCELQAFSSISHYTSLLPPNSPATLCVSHFIHCAQALRMDQYHSPLCALETTLQTPHPTLQNSYLLAHIHHLISRFYRINHTITDANRHFSLSNDIQIAYFPQSPTSASQLSFFIHYHTSNIHIFTEKTAFIEEIMQKCRFHTLIYVTCVALLAEFHGKIGQFQEAKKYYEIAQNIFETHFEKSEQFASFCCGFAEILVLMNEIEAAIRKLEFAFEILIKNPPSLEILRCLRIFSRLEIPKNTENRYKIAQNAFLENFKLTRYTINFLHEFSQFYLTYSDFKTAEIVSKTALNLSLSHFPSSRCYISSLEKLGSVYFKWRKYEEMESYCLQAVMQLRRHFAWTMAGSHMIRHCAEMWIHRKKMGAAEGYLVKAYQETVRLKSAKTIDFNRCLVLLRSIYE